MDSVDDTVARLRKVVRVINRRAQADTGEGSPTRSQQAVLGWLDERGRLSLGDLAGLEGMRPQSMTELVDACEARGWVVRRRDDPDRRKVAVCLTVAGGTVLNVGRVQRQAWLSEAMRSGLDVDEQRLLAEAVGLLERVALGPRKLLANPEVGRLERRGAG